MYSCVSFHMCRGEDFRPEYDRCIKIRSFFCNVPLVCLSAAVTTKIFIDVRKKMHLTSDKFVLKALPPDRPNIYLEVKHPNNYVIALVNGCREQPSQSAEDTDVSSIDKSGW